MDGNYHEDHRWDIAYYRSHDVLEPANPILFGKLMTRAFQNTIGLHGPGYPEKSNRPCTTQGKTKKTWMEITMRIIVGTLPITGHMMFLSLQTLYFLESS